MRPGMIGMEGEEVSQPETQGGGWGPDMVDSRVKVLAGFVMFDVDMRVLVNGRPGTTPRCMQGQRVDGVER